MRSLSDGYEFSNMHGQGERKDSLSFGPESIDCWKHYSPGCMIESPAPRPCAYHCESLTMPRTLSSFYSPAYVSHPRDHYPWADPRVDQWLLPSLIKVCA